MPKGQYTRKPKVIGAEHVVPDVSLAELNALAQTAPQRNAASLQRMMDEQPAIREAVHAPPPPPPPESFDDWMEADAPVMPANDRVTQMVGEWAASFCNGEHFATWLPSADGQGLVVTLVTAHASTELTRPAGQWREADITAALASMRTELGV